MINLDEMSNDEIEIEAKKQGFNAEYTGENKKTPKEFLEIAFSHNGMLKERNEKLSNEVDGLTNEVKGLNDKMTTLVKFQEDQKTKAVNKAIKELKIQRKDAITDGDHEKVELLDQQIEEEKQSDDKSGPRSNKVFDTWKAKNQWYDNKRIGAKADLLFDQYANTGRFDVNDAGYNEILDIVTEEIKQQFPEQFRNQKKDKPPEVDGGGPSSDRSTKKTYADLPPEAKSACDTFVADEMMSKDEYLSMYEWD